MAVETLLRGWVFEVQNLNAGHSLAQTKALGDSLKRWVPPVTCFQRA